MEVDPVIVQSATALGVAAIGAGWWNKRAVRNAVAEHGDHEMAHLEAIENQLEMLRKVMETSNELQAQHSALIARQIALLQHRVEMLERVG